MKIFVSGLYCSGKTTFSKKFAQRNEIEYVSFDEYFNYWDKNFDAQAQRLFESLGDRHFAIDAIPFNSGLESFTEFNKYYEEHRDVSIIFVFCPDFNIWFKRLEMREDKSPNLEDCKRDYKYNNRDFLKKIHDKIMIFYNSMNDELVDYSQFKQLTSWLDK